MNVIRNYACDGMKHRQKWVLHQMEGETFCSSLVMLHLSKGKVKSASVFYFLHLYVLSPVNLSKPRGIIYVILPLNDKILSTFKSTLNKLIHLNYSTKEFQN